MQAQPIDRGRGARSNASSRFDDQAREAFDDGWPDMERAPKLRTTVLPMTVKTIIARNDSPDVPFDRSINPYRGCEHGCVYCFARPAHILACHPDLISNPDCSPRPTRQRGFEANSARGITGPR